MTAPHIVLGISKDASPDEVRAAYAAAVKADHPDHGGPGTSGAELKLARDQMLGRVPLTGTCKVCGGRGWIKTGGFKSERCPRGC